MILAILPCKIREATYLCFNRALNRADAQRERERERSVRAGKERPCARAEVSFRCIIFSFATSRIHKQHVQLDTQMVVMVINTVNSNHSRVRA